MVISCTFSSSERCLHRVRFTTRTSSDELRRSSLPKRVRHLHVAPLVTPRRTSFRLCGTIVCSRERSSNSRELLPLVWCQDFPLFCKSTVIHEHDNNYTEKESYCNYIYIDNCVYVTSIVGADACIIENIEYGRVIFYLPIDVFYHAS